MPSTPLPSTVESRRLLVALLVVLAAAPVAGVTASATADETAIHRDTITAHSGSFVDVTVSVPPGAEATLLLQRTTNAVTTRAVVRDGGDGEVVVRLNTYTGRWTVRSAEDAVVSQDTNPGRALRPARYKLGIETETGADRATLEVRPETLTGMTTWVASPGQGSFTNASAVRSALTAGQLAPAEQVSENVTVVVRLDAPGLPGMLAATPGDNTSTRFRRLFRRNGTLGAEQSNPPPERAPATIPLLASSGVHVLPDKQNGTYFVTVDLSHVRVMRVDEPDPDFEFGDAEFAVTAGLSTNVTLDEAAERVQAFIAPRSAHVVRDPNTRYPLFAAREQRIEGWTRLGSGEQMMVVVRSGDDPGTDRNESFIRTATATVRDQGLDYRNTFTAVLNLSGVPRGTRATVDVTARNRSLLDQKIAAHVAETTAAIQAESGMGVGGPEVTVTATLARGGFIVLYENGDGERVVGKSRYLDPGQHYVTLAVDPSTDAETVVDRIHADTDDDREFDGGSVDRPYPVGSQAVDLPEPTTTSTMSPADTTPADTTATTGLTSTSASSSTERRTSQAPVPSPGLLGGGLAVIAGFVLTVVRVTRN